MVPYSRSTAHTFGFSVPEFRGQYTEKSRRPNVDSHPGASPRPDRRNEPRVADRAADHFRTRHPGQRHSKQSVVVACGAEASAAKLPAPAEGVVAPGGYVVRTATRVCRLTVTGATNDQPTVCGTTSRRVRGAAVESRTAAALASASAVTSGSVSMCMATWRHATGRSRIVSTPVRCGSRLWGRAPRKTSLRPDHSGRVWLQGAKGSRPSCRTS